MARARGITPALLAAVLLVGAAVTVARAAPGSPTQSVAVPAYFDPPSSGWSALEHDDPPVRLIVVNPESGPGSAPRPSYLAAVRAAQAEGVTIVGYVDTGFARRPLSALEAQIDEYYSWYGVNGIFFDDASTACAQEPYYAALGSYVKAKGASEMTILNPGTWTNSCYANAADILLTFEGSYHQYVHSYFAPSWVTGYPPSRFWQIVYATPTISEMRRAVGLSRGRGVGFVFVTSAREPNPYGALPADRYWCAELARVAGPQPTGSAGRC
jgi:hypothetical protein